ncbi:MAG: M28 family peptidase [Thermoplasmatales archaeon]|nr:M28 family peptidase [Thermoplasmatales archaeon]
MKKKINCILFASILIFSNLLLIPSINANTKTNYSLLNENNIVEMINKVNRSLILNYHDGLMTYGARYTGSENCTLAGEYIYNSFEKIGLEVAYHNWDFGGYKSRNIVATLPGKDLDSNAIFIMSAHYDCSEGSMGANDDGSGVAGMLAIAEIMSNYSFNHTIRFIAFSGEEVGTYGSFTYARDAYNRGDNIVAVINVDMIAYAVTPEGANLISFMHPERSTWIFDFAETVSNNYYDYFNLSVESKPNHRGADHQAFVDFGYDGVWIVHHDTYPWANTPMDTPDRLNWSYQVKATKFLIALMAEISNKPIDVQAIITAPYEGYLYVIGFPLFQLNFLKNWNSGIRGTTILLGNAVAKVKVISDEEFSHVIFCIDNDFLFWDSDPPYEWKIIGWYLLTAIGRHTLRVFAYTNSGKVGYDEMDLFMLTKPQYKGKWPPSQPCHPNPENGAINVPVTTNLSWDGGDYDPGDVVYYDVYFGTDSNPPFIEQIGPFGWNQINLIYDLPELTSNTTYYWKIVASDVQGASSKSQIWSFTTI